MALPTPETLARLDAERRAELSPWERLSPQMREMLHEMMLVDTHYVPNRSYWKRRETAQEDWDSRFIDCPEPDPKVPVEQLRTVTEPEVADLLQAPVLGPALEHTLFRRMNYCYFRATAMQNSVRSGKFTPLTVSDLQYYLEVAQQTEQRIIAANHRWSIGVGIPVTRQQGADGLWDLGDYISEGYIVLQSKVRHFDVQRGFSFGNFVYKSLRGHFQRCLRSRSFADDDQLTVSEHGRRGRISPIHGVDSEIIEFAVEHALSDLFTDYERSALLLRLRGMTYEEIAQELGRKRGGAHAAVMRGIEKLQWWMQEMNVSSLEFCLRMTEFWKRTEFSSATSPLLHASDEHQEQGAVSSVL